IDTLTDTAPEGATKTITDIVENVPGVVEVERTRIRKVGDHLFVDLNVAVSRTLPIDRVAAVKDAIMKAIRGEFPKSEISVTTEPRALSNETILERVMVTARNRAL